MELSNEVCRICLNMIHDPISFHNLECITEKLQTVVPDAKIQVDSNVMCNECCELLNSIYNFKYNCYKVEETIIKKVSKIKKNFQLKLCDIMQYNKITPKPLKNNIGSTCRTCLRFYERLELNVDENLINLLKSCVPELDINLTLNPEICEICAKVLHKWNDFKTTCLNTDKLIQQYCTSFNKNSKNIRLNKVLEYAKLCNWHNMDTTEYISTENNFNMKFECSETGLQMPIQEIKSEANQTIKDFPRDDDFKVIILGSKETVLKSMKRNGVSMYICPKCKKFVINIKSHLSEHGERLKLCYQCSKCSYRNKSMVNLKKHVLSHNQEVPDKPYKCDQCSFQARQKGNLMTHLLVHKNVDEIKMFKCRLCKFQARQKGNLKTHLLTHKKPEEIRMFKCNICKFQARQNGNLQTHMLKKHKPFNEKALEEALFYKCSQCSYKVKHKPSLKKHICINNS